MHFGTPYSGAQRAGRVGREGAGLVVDQPASPTADQAAAGTDATARSAAEPDGLKPFAAPAQDGPPTVAAADAPASADGPASHTEAASTPPHRPLPAAIAHQLAVNISHRPGHSVVVTLSPDELGKVTMNVSAQDGTLTLALSVERGDTLDLLRRHIDQLAQDFRDLGFCHLNFSFSQDRQGHPGADDQPATTGHNSVPIAASPPEPSPATPPSARQDGLDLRL